MTRYVTINKFSELSGYTKDAVNAKIDGGHWREGKEFIKAPDGRRLIDVQGFEEWATGAYKAGQGRSTSRSRGKGSRSGALSISLIPPLTANTPASSSGK